MSLKNPRNLLIIGAVVAALLAGTILLGGYVNILPAGSDTGSQAEAAPATGQTSCPMAKAYLAEDGDVTAGCPREAAAGDVKTCPPGCTKPCCAEEAEGCCPKKAEDSCPKEAEGCCPKKAEGSCPKEAASS